MNDLPVLNYLGWAGFAGLMTFYWMIGSGRPVKAYLASIFGAAMFMAVGVASQMGYSARMPSLTLMEGTIIGLNLRAIWKLKNG